MAPLRLWIWFGIASLLMFVMLAVSPVRHAFPEWREVQHEFNQLVSERYQMGQNVRPVSTGLRQNWIPELNVVDRCTTCHLGVGEKALADAPEPFRSHPTTPHKLEKIGCTICHRGQGRATTAKAAHGATRHWESPMLPSYYVSGSCGSCHREPRPPENHILTEGRRLMDRSACVACHLIPGFNRTRQAGPDLSVIGSKVRPEWLYRWLKEPFNYLPKSRMPDFHLSDSEVATLTSYLLTFKDKDLESQAGSALEKSLAGASQETVDNGEARYRLSRCISCHAQEGRGGTVGPDLGKVGSKMKPLALDAWIQNPRRYFADSTMPRYGFTARQRHDVVSYILSEFADYDLDPEETRKILAAIPKATDAVMREGEKLFALYGCGRCHSLTGKKNAGEFAPDLTREGVKDLDRLDFGKTKIPHTLVDWLYTKNRTPRVFGGNLKMPDFHFSAEQARSVTTALLSLTGDSIPYHFLPPAKPKSTYNPNGAFGKLVKNYQCLTCHKIRGTGGDMAPDLTREGSIARPEWIRRYFKVPYSLRPIMTERMPNLAIKPEDINTAVRYMSLVLADDSIPKEIFSRPPGRDLINAGKQLFYDKYGCQACHQAHQKGGYVGPPLDGIREHYYSGYIYEWLLNPQRFIPDTIDPNQNMTPEEARAITAFVYSLPPAGAQQGGSQ